MAPTQRHGWLTLPDSHSRRRTAGLVHFALDVAREDFERRHPGVRFGPVVAVVAAYEEEENIGAVLKAMPTLLGDLEVSTLVVVDGGSDDTAQVADDAGAYTCVLPVNLGQGAALRLGYELASAHGARYVVTLDADGQNDPAEMASMLEPLLDDTADFVIASRRIGTDRTTDRFRRAGVRIYAWLLNAIIKQQLTDSSNGYRAFRIEVLEDIGPHLIQDQYQTAEVVITASSRGWRITQRPTEWHPRAVGQLEEGRQPHLRLRLRQGHPDHLGPGDAGQPPPQLTRVGDRVGRALRRSVAAGHLDRPVVELLDRLGELLGQLVDPAPGHPALPVRGGPVSVRPTTRWMCRGRGSVRPLGMTEAEPPIPTGITVAPVRAARNATPSWRSPTTGPGRGARPRGTG